jgi:hypothetical protein
MLCFIKPDNICNTYKKIKNKYNNFKDFFQYFEKNWKHDCKYKKLKIIPEWNYKNLLNSLELEQKYLYITNNIAEHINKILNSKLNYKYSNLDIWKIAILVTKNNINNQTNILERENILLFGIKKIKI